MLFFNIVAFGAFIVVVIDVFWQKLGWFIKTVTANIRWRCHCWDSSFSTKHRQSLC